MKKIIVIISLLLIVLSSSLFVTAHSEETFSQAENIIKNNISCENISDKQLEKLGDYYMEQMHPGESHEKMDQMMGGEGSENLKQMHILMGKNFYCSENKEMTLGMIGYMMNKDSLIDNNEKMMNNDKEIMNYDGGMMKMMGFGISNGFMGISSGWWWFSMLFMAFIWISIIVGIVFLLIWAYKKITQSENEKINVLDILKKRYAEGEITKKQFNEIKKDLISK